MADTLTPTTTTRPKEPPYFNLVEFRNGSIDKPCQYCDETRPLKARLTRIEMHRHRGARGFPAIPVCLIHATGLKYHFLNAGTIVQIDKGALDKRISGG